VSDVGERPPSSGPFRTTKGARTESTSDRVLRALDVNDSPEPEPARCTAPPPRLRPHRSVASPAAAASLPADTAAAEALDDAGSEEATEATDQLGQGRPALVEISLADLLAMPLSAGAGALDTTSGAARGATAAALSSRAFRDSDELERAISGSDDGLGTDARDASSTTSGDADDEHGWPKSARRAMPLRTVNRWGVASPATLELEWGVLRYESRSAFKPADLLDMVNDDSAHDECALLLTLAPRGRGRPKRLLVHNGAQRQLLAGWLAAWKLGVEPEHFLEASNAGVRGVHASAGRSSSAPPSGGLGRAPNGRTGTFVLGTGRAAAVATAHEART
jgi:hypothetical protein